MEQNIADYKQKEIALKKINQILKDKIKSLELTNNALTEENQRLAKTKEIKQQVFSKYSVIVIIGVFVLGLTSPHLNVLDNSILHAETYQKAGMMSKYVVENLRGDVIETNVSWKWAKESPMNISIINTELINKEKVEAIKTAITSNEKIWLDDSLMHKGQEGNQSLYFSGWRGAVDQLQSRQTLFNPPFEYNIFPSSISEGNIVITLEPFAHKENYSGYTKNIVDNNEILKSYITIYDVTKLSTAELNTIVKHEFGHALGLAHSTDPQDLMYPVITTEFPLISECSIDALESVYDGNVNSEVVCRK